MPVTNQPKSSDDVFAFKSPRDDCRPEDCCCCCLFVYLLFGKEIKSQKYQSTLKPSDKKDMPNYCYFNNLSDDTGDCSSWFIDKQPKKDDDGDSDGWMPTAASSSSNNCSHCSHSPLGNHEDSHGAHGFSASNDNGGDTAGDCDGCDGGD